MKTVRLVAALLTLAYVLLLGPLSRAVAAPPAAPTVLAPANAANVQIPLTAQWSAVSEPGIIAYNWQLSDSSTFSPVLKIGSTSGATEAVLSGLANGTYYFRVQAVNSGFEQGAWSAARSFTVTGAGTQAPGASRLDPPGGYATFHPWETMRFSWSPVPGAVSYIYEASTDARFPVTSTLRFDNIAQPQYGFAIANPEGTYTARVFAVNADGIVGQPSNTIQFSVFYGNPVPPPPQPVGPADGATLTLPVTFEWTHTLNPQPSGYELQVSSTPDFQTNETPTAVQLTDNKTIVRSLSTGPKFWRVRSHQGMASPTTTAATGWSPVRSFSVSTAPAVPVSVTPVRIPLYSGDDTAVELQLSGPVPAGGASVALASSHPDVLPVPATHAVQGSHAWSQFRAVAGQVAAPTPVTLTATYNGASASSQFTLHPPTLKALSLGAPTTSAGVPIGAQVTLAGRAPEGGAVVSLSSSSPAVQPPATVTVPAGSYSAAVSLPTSDVTARTPVTITATWNGVSTQASVALMPAPQPLALSLSPSTINAGQVADGLVTVDTTANFDQQLRVSSNNPDILPFLSSAVIVPAGDNRGRISIMAKQVVATSTVVTIAVTGSGVTRTADLTVNPAGTPAPAPSLSSLRVTPTSVVGGQQAAGTVTLAQAAPTGGVSVALGSNQPGAASVPASVLVPAGATSASFDITTFPSAGTTVQLNARLGDSAVFAALAVTAAPSGPTLSSLTLSPSAVVAGASASGTVTLTGAAPAGGASVALADNSSAIGTPASVTVPAGASSANFTVTTGPVSTATTGNVTASYGGATRSASLTVNAPANAAPAAPALASPAQDASPSQPVVFDWNDVSGATSYRIQIENQSTFAAPFVVDQIVTASQFTAPVLQRTRHWWRVQAINSDGVAGAWSSVRRFTPQAAPASAALSSIVVSPTSVTGGTAARATVSLTAAAPTGGAAVNLASSNGDIARVPASVVVPAGSTSASVDVETAAVAASTTVNISATYGSTSRAASLSITAPAASAALSSLALNPGSLQGGSGPSQGTVMLTAPAPSGGYVVQLASSHAAATVPASLTVPQGASSATFTIGTAQVAVTTSATITATAGTLQRSASLSLLPPAQTWTLTVAASGRSGERITSSPAGVNVAVGSSGSGAFQAGTTVTLSVSNGRDAIWSGACSSNGAKRPTCSFSISGNASVNANVQ